jgi:hypothetical protein
MQIIVVVSLSVAALVYAGEIPQVLQFPLPLTLGAIFTSVILYALAKA